MNLEHILAEKYGYRNFRPGQKEIITDILAGKNVFAMLPTGAGKSMTYLIPGHIFDGMILIISPLLSLMEDQVRQLKSNGEKRVAALNSFLTQIEKRHIITQLGQYKYLFLSPEALQNEYLFKQLMKQKISLFVIDEAHCISQWGHEFRTDYLKLGEMREKLGAAPCLALTATAPLAVQNDIINQLRMTSPVKHIHNVDRVNIALTIKEVQTEQEKVTSVIKLVKHLKGQGIIYFSSRFWTSKMAELLQQETTLKVASYHGGMAQEDRQLIQQQFIQGQLDVICCTSAFGMGVNKPNIRYVIHFHFPPQMEAFVQEIGRAGRDGEMSISYLFYKQDDQAIPAKLVESEFPSEETLQQLWPILKGVNKNRETLTEEIEQQVIEQMMIAETTWRFIKYQLEKLSVIKEGQICTFDEQKLTNEIMGTVATRKRFKLQKVNEMVQFLTSESCLREEIVHLFDQELINKPRNCCSNCGFIEDEYFRDEPHREKRYVIDWQEELTKLFLKEEGIL